MFVCSRNCARLHYSRVIIKFRQAALTKNRTEQVEFFLLRVGFESFVRRITQTERQEPDSCLRVELSVVISLDFFFLRLA